MQVGWVRNYLSFVCLLVCLLACYLNHTWMAGPTTVKIDMVASRSRPRSQGPLGREVRCFEPYSKDVAFVAVLMYECYF
jgi:hypothetical protein